MTGHTDQAETRNALGGGHKRVAHATLRAAGGAPARRAGEAWLAEEKAKHAVDQTTKKRTMEPQARPSCAAIESHEQDKNSDEANRVAD